MPPPPRPSITILTPHDGEYVPVALPLNISMRATGRGVRVWLNNDPPVTASKVAGLYSAHLTPTMTGPVTLSANARSYFPLSRGKTQTINLHVIRP